MRLRFASSACSKRRRTRSRVTRTVSASSGIQLTPFTNTGWSLTTSVNGVPASSGVVSHRTSRKPTTGCVAVHPHVDDVERLLAVPRRPPALGGGQVESHARRVPVHLDDGARQGVV